MRRYFSYINTSLRILQLYKGEIPFSIFLKQYFNNEKKYGSSDRKNIAAICYNYFRAGHFFNKQLSEEILITAFFIINTEPSLFIQNLKPNWNEYVGQPIEKKLALIKATFNVLDIFPYKDALTEGLNVELFSQSFIIQPGLFVRVRPKIKKAVIEKIKASGYPYILHNDNNCVQFPSGINIEKFLVQDREVVVQDYNSQLVLNYMANVDYKQPTVWDCCAASGGKSILMYDLLGGNMKLTVSDIRQTILANLQKRFAIAGIKNYKHFVCDISLPSPKNKAEKYDIIICDAPCTGSGTWSRTPEQLYFFDSASIDAFSQMQKKIACNALSHLNDNGLFFYITCSVFKKENEEVANYISHQPGIALIEMKSLFGYQINADSMFVAVFKKE